MILYFERMAILIIFMNDKKKGKLMLRNLWIIVALACLFFAPVQAQEKITLTTLDWEPYIGQSLKKQGYVAEIIREVFKRSGYEVEMKFTPWARAVYLAKEGFVDGYFPEYYADEIKAFAMFSDPFQGGPLGFFKQKDRDISFNTLKDLMSYKIGVVRDYINTKEFDQADYLTKEAVNDDLTNLKKLIAGRIHLMVGDQFVGLYLMEKNQLEGRENIEFMMPPLELKDLYLCISRKTPDADKKLAAFNKGLKEITEDGTLKQILTDHGFLKK